MAITLTPSAIQRASQFLGATPGAVALRLGVRKTGCSGWGYEVEVAEKIAVDDALFEQDGVKVVIDPKSLPLVNGTEVDFVRSGLNQTFVFRNPNAKGECGCGESFTTEISAEL